MCVILDSSILMFSQNKIPKLLWLCFLIILIAFFKYLCRSKVSMSLKVQGSASPTAIEV
jgi:hypothetical protein